MEKVPLWRTARLGMVTYQPDGLGRDKYIKYNNGGFWDTGEKFEVKKEYERPKYSNFHSLYHQAAPFKYYSNGKTRDSYILFNTGLSKDIKPLGSYKLTDFLRANETGAYRSGKVWVSKSQDKYNKLLRAKEKDIIFRLYENEKKKFMKKKKGEEELNDNMEDNKEEVLKPIQTEVEVTKLPKLIDKKKNYSCINTLNGLNNDLDKDYMEDNEKEVNKISDANKKKNLLHIFPKNKSNNEEILIKSLSKINDFDVSKKLKRTNKSFNQAYFHLRNVNYDQKYE
jgi:hypothetical protein